MSPAPHRRALACAAAVSLILLVGLSVLWVHSREQAWSARYFHWNYGGDITKSVSWDAIFRISGGELGFQAVRYSGNYPTHQRYYRRMGDSRTRWQTRIDLGNNKPLTQTPGWPTGYGLHHNGEDGTSQSWRLVLPFWGVFLFLALFPAWWAYRALRLHMRPDSGYTPAPSDAAAAPAVAAPGSAGMPQNHAAPKIRV